jgi:hypothetical protein
MPGRRLWGVDLEQVLEVERFRLVSDKAMEKSSQRRFQDSIHAGHLRLRR